MKTVCIICPIGCELVVEKIEDEVVVEGNKCPRGENYGIEEYLDPKRLFISVVRCKNGELPVVSVKSSRPISKSLIPVFSRHLADMELEAPVRINEVIVKNILNTGVDIVATRECKKIS